MKRTKQSKQRTFLVEAIEIRGFFKKIETLCIPSTALYLGKVRIAVYSLENMEKGRPYVIQNCLPDFPVILGRFRTEKECQIQCINLARAYCSLLNME